MTGKKSCEHDEHGSVEHSLFLLMIIFIVITVVVFVLLFGLNHCMYDNTKAYVPHLMDLVNYIWITACTTTPKHGPHLMDLVNYIHIICCFPISVEMNTRSQGVFVDIQQHETWIRSVQIKHGHCWLFPSIRATPWFILALHKCRKRSGGFQMLKA